MKKILLIATAASLASSMSAAPSKGLTKYSDIHPSGTEAILHAWSWNFKNIAENMKKIADAGYSMGQTSPVQHCWNPELKGDAIL